MPLEYESRGVYHAHGYTTQRSDWFARDEGGDWEYAFHEWAHFPHFGKVFAAAIYRANGVETDIDKEHFYYWLEGSFATADDLQRAVRELGLDPAKYTPEDEPYSDGVFPVATTFDDAKAYFEARRAKTQHLKQGEENGKSCSSLPS